MKLGVCADPKAAPMLKEAGFDFIELHVQNHLKTTADEAAFEGELERIQGAPLPALAANCFVPGSLKITGPDVDREALAAYAQTAFARAARAGIALIVFGSGGARRIPEGFERERAWEQLLVFGRMLGPLAQQHDVTVVVEPLNLKECNVLTSVGEAGRYVEQVDHPNVRLLADSYHWLVDEDSFDDLMTYGPLIHHVHVATKESRRPPGLESCDFQGFFAALRRIGYEGGVSIEARWEDMEAEAAEAHAALQALVTGES